MTSPPAATDNLFDGRLPPPSFAAIETTMFCNLKCHFCIQYQNGTTVTGPHMEPEVFEVVSDKLFPHLTSFQPSVSGEPLMSKGLDQVLAKAERMAVRAEYYTNATLLKPSVIERILPTAGRINISFDGATKETYEALRAGANFETVVTNIRALVAAAKELPAEHRPIIGFACTLMERNIDELPLLVDLAAELQIDLVRAAHVIPGNEEMQTESCYHDPTRAGRAIDAAITRAQEHGIAFSVQPLDELIVNLATTEELAAPTFRNPAAKDGVMTSLRNVLVNQDLCRPWPSAPPRGAEQEFVRDDDAPNSSSQPEPAAAADKPESIWVCDFLWSRLYIGHEGNTTPCCIPGVPLIGDLRSQQLDDVWNGDIERAMRLSMAQKSPAACCRGCQHIREIDDPKQIEQYLLGKQLPSEPVRLPPELRPVTGLPSSYPDETTRHVDAPTLSWPQVEGRESYVLQVSTDAFANLLFSTDWYDLSIDEAQYTIPDWAWTLAKPGKPLHWQVLAVLEDERRVAGYGALERVTPATSDVQVERHVDAPTLTWPETTDGEGYVVQISTDGFCSVAFSTERQGTTVHRSQYSIPEQVWVQAEPEQTVHWQALAVRGDERRVVGYGALQRVVAR